MDIDAIIAAGTTAPAAEAQPQADATTAEPQVAETEQLEGESTEPKADAKPEDMFPKKAVNALSRRDKKIGKQAAEIQQLRQEVERLAKTAPQTPKQADNAPKESDYQTYGEYLDALTDYKADLKVNQKFSEIEKKTTEQKQQSDEQKWESERSAAIDDNADKAKEAYPDFDSVMQENAEELHGIAPHVRRAILEADNGAFALYQLAKEGMLDSLNDMSPMKVAMTIARMEDKALSKPKPVTKAPAPMTAARGVATGAKTLDRMSWDEMSQWLSAKS